MNWVLFWFCVISFNTALLSTFKLYYANHEETKFSKAIQHTLSIVVNGILVYLLPGGHRDFWMLAFCLGLSFASEFFMPKALDGFLDLTRKDKSENKVAVSNGKVK